MADALLKVLLTELSSLIKGELGLVIGFKKEFEKLSSTLSTIQCVLEDAQMKQLKDKALENWLKKLNAAAYEVDDIVDECKTKAKRFKQSRFGWFHLGIIPFRYKMGKKMKEVMEKLDSIAEERIKFHLRKRTGEQLNAFVGPETELSSLIQGELGLVIGFKKEFEKLSSTFSTIQSVLEDAQMKQLKDKALENWLKKLSAAACEVDDIVD